MVEIPCLVCNKALELPQFIDEDNYDGQLVCSKCKSLLHLKLIKGKARKYEIIKEHFLPVVTKIVKHYRETEKVREKEKDKKI